MRRPLLKCFLLLAISINPIIAIGLSSAAVKPDHPDGYNRSNSPKGPKTTHSSFEDLDPERMSSFLSSLHKQYPAISDRLDRISEQFLGKPYMASPLGEGPGNPPDEDPLIRFDAFDCTTFIEEVMALALSEDFTQALTVLRRIRYFDGKIGYKWRKHFTEAQWIPNNQKIGFLKDITLKIAPQKTIWVKKHLDATTWNMRHHPEKWPELKDEDIPSGTFSIPVVPIKDVLSIRKKIPNGTIMNIIREDLHTYPTRVTHQGLVIQKSGKTYFRHAGRAVFARVVDEPLEHFIKRNKAYRKWVVTGFNFQKVLEPKKEKKPNKGFLHDNLAPSHAP